MMGADDRLDADDHELAYAVLMNVSRDTENWTPNARRVAAKLADVIGPHALIPPHLQEGAPVTKATEIEPGKQYILNLDSNPTAEQVDQIRATLQERFPSNRFVLANKAAGLSVYAPAVMHDELVAALTKAAGACDAQWAQARGEDKLAWYGAGVALQELRAALLTPERDGAATPPAATTGGTPPAADESATAAPTAEEAAPSRPMEINWPRDLDPDDRAGIAEQLEALAHQSGLTYWRDVARAIRSVRAPR